MPPVRRESGYRLRLAEGFVAEARQDLGLQRWRSCVDSSQLAVENALKAVLALFGPVGRTHAPSSRLQEALGAGAIPEDARALADRLVAIGQVLGPDVHAESDYGDEENDLTPWDIFGPEEANHSFGMAEEALGITRRLVARV